MTEDVNRSKVTSKFDEVTYLRAWVTLLLGVIGGLVTQSIFKSPALTITIFGLASSMASWQIWRWSKPLRMRTTAK
jgi:hypothetical protein